MTVEPHRLTAAEIASSVRSGALRAEAVTQAMLERVARLDGALGCFLCVDEEGALAAARAVDERVARGEDPGALAGVPVGLKDLLVTRGLATTAGSKILASWIPPYDGTVVARLRRAGAVLLGKLNLDEFAMGSSNERSAYGPVRNPWDRTRVPGGSSGGSAAAVAAGLCAIALGTDTGGSIRQPAALCGVVGIKPTWGRVSRHGVVAFASSLDQVGPLARTAEDCALALGVIAGHDPLDATSIAEPPPDYAAAARGATDLRGLTVGVVDEWLGGVIDPAVAARLREAIATLEQLGARTRPVALPHARHALAAYYLIAPAEASSNLARYDGVRYGLREGELALDAMYAKTRAAGFGSEVKRRILLGTYALRAGYYDAYYLRAQKVRALVARDFERAFAEHDLLIGPTTPTVAFSIGATQDPLAMYANDVFTIPANLAGIPALSVPCGFAGHLPTGMQLLAPPLGEVALLRAAAAYQRATDFLARRPVEEPAA